MQACLIPVLLFYLVLAACGRVKQIYVSPFCVLPHSQRVDCFPQGIPLPPIPEREGTPTEVLSAAPKPSPSASSCGPIRLKREPNRNRLKVLCFSWLWHRWNSSKKPSPRCPNPAVWSTRMQARGMDPSHVIPWLRDRFALRPLSRYPSLAYHC